MVTETVAVRDGPLAAVAVTVTVEVTGVGVTWLPLAPPPQPQMPSTSNPAARRENGKRFLRSTTGSSRRTPTRPKPEPLNQPMRIADPRTALRVTAFEVEIVMVSVAMSTPSGVRLGGAKLQLAPPGRPEHVKVTTWLNPPFGMTARAAVPG